MTEINLFSYKQISQSNQRVKFNRKTSLFFNQKRKNQTKIKTILMNEIQFSVDRNTKKSESINTNDNENQKTIKTESNKFKKFVSKFFNQLSFRLNATFLFLKIIILNSRFTSLMSMNKNLFIFQKKSNDLKSIKKNVIEKKNFDQKKIEKFN